MGDNYKHFFVENMYQNKVLKVTLNRPPVNAFIKESYEELCEIIQRVEEDKDICAVILNANGRLFSAGADVKQLAKDNQSQASIRRAALRKAISVLYYCPVPLITAVNGGALGAGAIFAVCGDIIIADEDAYFSLPEINVGIIGGAKGLSRFIPPQKVRTMALTGAKLSADEAYNLGGVEKVVKKEDLLTVACEYAKELSDKGGMTVRKWKEALLATEDVDAVNGFMIEQNLSLELAQLKEKRI